MTGNEEAARRAGLPLSGEVRGVITLVQCNRFRVEDEEGRGYLFTLGWEAGSSMEELSTWSEQRIPVTVSYQGPPDLGAVARSVKPNSQGA